MKDRQNTDDIADSEIELEPFDKPVETDPTEAVEEAEPYFPRPIPSSARITRARHGSRAVSGQAKRPRRSHRQPSPMPHPTKRSRTSSTARCASTRALHSCISRWAWFREWCACGDRSKTE